MKFEEAVNQQLCKISSTLDKLRMLHEAKEKRDTDIVFIAIPEDATPSVGTRSFAVGTTKIDFRTGVIQNPDGTLEYLNTKLNDYKLSWLHSLSIDANQHVTIKLEGKPKRTVYAGFSTQIPYLTYYTLEITCSVVTDIQVFACTNPSAVIGQFKAAKVNIIEQDAITGDVTEAQTWDAVVNLKHNLNRIRKRLNDIIGGTSWSDAVSASLFTIWGKFNATTGHKHTGGADDAPKIPDTSLESPVATHASLTTGTHGVSASGFEDKANKAAASGYPSLNASSKVVQDPANATATPTASKIPIASASGKLDSWITGGSGVTNGNTHDHYGGDGAQIDHTTLSNIGANTHAQIDNHINNTAWFSTLNAVTGSRALDTQYTNSLNRPIMVSVSAYKLVGNHEIYAEVQGIQVGKQSVYSDTTLQFHSNLTFVVPAGLNYIVRSWNSPTLSTWMEWS